MKTSKAVLLLAILLLATQGLAAGVKMPPFQSFTMDNGLRVNMMRQTTVPLINFEIWIDAGSSLDSPGREGLASLTVEALRKGCHKHDAAAFAEALDFLGARFSTSVNLDRTRISLQLMSRDLDEGLALLGGALLKPKFQDDEIAKLIAQMSDDVIQSKDSPRAVLRRFHYAHLYGDHPYGNAINGTEGSLNGIGGSEVRRFYRDHYGADRTILTVTGDFEPREMERKIRKAFKKMKRAGGDQVTLTDAQLPEGNRILLVDKSDTPQTWFCIGGFGPEWGCDDHAAAMVVQTVFGGRFTSWLNTKLRIESGLTYGAGYRFNQMKLGGPAYISSFTATENTGKAFQLALAQLDRLHDEGLSEDELISAKAYLKGQIPYDYETARDHAQTISAISFYGVDRAYIDRLFVEIEAVDLEACARVTEKYFRRDRLAITAIAPADEVEEALRQFGQVTVRDISLPGFR